MTVAGQPAVGYTYDLADRLTQIAQSTSTVGFSYDNANRRSTLTLPNGVTVAYSFDAASQLTGLTYSLGQTTLGNLTYGYDGAGRRAIVGGSFARTGLPLALSSATYNANNQLTQWGTAALTYDLNGNLTGDGVNNYSWDARNKLTTITSGGTTIGSFNYDAFGRRTNKTVPGVTASFLYDGVNAVQERSGSLCSCEPKSSPASRRVSCRSRKRQTTAEKEQNPIPKRKLSRKPVLERHILIIFR